MSVAFDDEEQWELEIGNPEAEYAPVLVVVIDTSTIIQIKRVIPTADQWDIFEQMLLLVREGRLAFPGQVHREVARQKHPDAPGVWCSRAVREVVHADASEDTLVEILPHIAQLVDENTEPENEPADPYVVAMAYELRAAGYDVAVATDDCIDRLPLKIAMTTACDALELPTWDCETFISWLGSTTVQAT